MATTVYTAQKLAGDKVEDLATKSKKSTAVDVARTERKQSGAHVRVVTGTGTVVFEQEAKKAIKMSPKYTRVCDVPEGVKVPKGLRVAYVRPRRNGAILHDAETGEYKIMKLDTGELLDETFEVTRDAGARLKAGV